MFVSTAYKTMYSSANVQEVIIETLPRVYDLVLFLIHNKDTIEKTHYDRLIVILS